MKDTVKQWIKAVDEALLKDFTAAHAASTDPLLIEAADDQQSPIVSPLAVLRATLPGTTDTAPAGSPSPEKIDDQPSPIVSPLAALGTPGATVTVPIDIHAHIDSIISPNYAQIDSLHRIETNLLRPFERGRKEVLLIFVQNKLVMPAMLESIHHSHLFVRTQHSTFLRKCGEILLMLIPVLPQKHYVLQLTVEKVYIHRLMLRYQDPRYDVRRQVRLAAPILLRLPPTTLLSALRQQQVGIIRHITLPPEASQHLMPGRLADQLYEMDTLTPSPHMERLEQTPALVCRLQDISLGGLSLTLSGEHQPQELIHRLIFLHIPLPPCSINSIAQEYLPVNLDLLSVIRGVRGPAQPLTLHIRFLKRLPEELAPYFAALERRFLEQQSPLA